MKKVFKTIFIYLGVLLLASMATVVLCAGFLFFYRDGNIFGIQYVKINQVILARETANMDNIETIEINSQKFDVIVKVSKVDELQGALINKVFGYAKKSKAQAKFSLDYNNATKTAVFSSSEPKGWLNKKDCGIEVAIPKSWMDAGYNIKIKTTSGDITVGGEVDWEVGEVIIDTGKGDVNLTNLNINKGINAKISSGSMTVGGDCESDNSIGVVLDLGSGKIDFSDINTEKLTLGVVEVKKIKRGQIGIKKLEELITNGNVDGGGKIEIGEVGAVDFISLDTNISINTILEGGSETTSRIKITGQGKISINKAYSNLEISGHNGNIYISQVVARATVSSNHGDIKIDNAKGYVSAVTEYGNINVTFSESALDYNTANKHRAIMATTKNGHIIVDGLQNGVVTATDKGRVSLNYNKVVGDNIVSVKSGTANIVVPNPTATSAPNEYAFNLKVDSEVNSDIKVGVAGSIGGVNSSTSGVLEFKNIYNSASYTNNNLVVSSITGLIKIRSLDLINF